MQEEDIADDEAREERTRREALRYRLSTYWRIYVPVVISGLLIITGIVLSSLRSKQTVRPTLDYPAGAL